jgi:hypothetical protein
VSFHCQPYHSVAGRDGEECEPHTSIFHDFHALAISLSSASILRTASNMAVHICTPEYVEGRKAQKPTSNQATSIKIKIPPCSNEPTPSSSASTLYLPPLQLPDMPTEYKHSPRSETTPFAIVVNDEPQQILTSNTLAAPSPSFTAADAVLDDLHKIQSCLNDLPEDLLAIISSFDHRLSAIEKVLAAYLSDRSALPMGTGFPAVPVGSVLSPAPASVSPNALKKTSLSTDPSSEGTTAVTIQSDPPATTSPATITNTEQDEPETTSYMKTRSTRITRTVTRTTTVPALRPTGIISNGNGTLPAVNGTGSSFMAPAPWTMPYLGSGFSSIVTVASTVEVNIAATPTI